MLAIMTDIMLQVDACITSWTPLRYPAYETARRHRRILREAARLFAERGFSAVSISEIMNASGLTHGPFYNHFRSKDALISECIDEAIRVTVEKLMLTPPTPGGKEAYFRWYLTQLRNDSVAGCVLIALASEMSREQSVRSSVTSLLSTTIDALSNHFPWSSKASARSEAIRTYASIIGAIVLMKAADDETLVSEILGQMYEQLSDHSD